MLNANKGVERLMEMGQERHAAVLSEWTDSDKNSLSFQDLQYFWKEMLSSSPEEAEILRLMKEKARKLSK